ncbi:MAG: cation:proton antiporter subunit C [Clostridia bacterium]|nr:cation:proton antiporter subunit C [Clostridia bacterium]
MGNLFYNYYDIAAVIIFSIGISLLLLNKNMIKKLIGFDLMDAATFIFLCSKGYAGGGSPSSPIRVAPIIENGIFSYSYYSSPIPTGLILTGIVVGVSGTAFALALIYRLYREYNTLDLDEIALRIKNEERGISTDAD